MFGLKMPIHAPNGDFLGILPTTQKSYALQLARHSPKATFSVGTYARLFSMVHVK